MIESCKKIPDRVVFIADAHLGMPGDNPERSQKLVSFLQWLKGKVTHLYIVGDLFDFWFEYKTVIPNTCPHVIFELYNLVRAGTTVSLFAGNHDYWLGPYLENSVGVKVELDNLVVEHQQKKIFIHHGDGLFPDDHGYRFLKKVLRNKLSIFVFRFLHPDIASYIAKITSKTSRDYMTAPDFEYKNTLLFRAIADNRLKEGYDAVVYGHSHVALVEKRPYGTLVLTGDWINKSTYVILQNGEFTIYNWETTKEVNNAENFQ